MRAAPDAGVRPLDADELSDLIARACPVPSNAAVAVAVSGGGDSMALALLMADWARGSDRALRTVTVDHALRDGSREEAERVAAWLGARGIDHDTLTWRGPKPVTGIQDAARMARYELIAGWAHTHGLRHVFLAHQLEDQAETMLMRLVRGSGLSGLGGMRTVSERDGILLYRPLLAVPRARLRATLRDLGQDWIEDPSNEAPRFARTGYRRLVGALADRDAGAGRLGAIANACAQLDGLLGVAAQRFLGGSAVWEGKTSVRLARDAFAALPGPVADTVLRHLVERIGARPHLPRGDRLARARARLSGPAPKMGFTLGYCRFAVDGHTIRIFREIGRSAADLEPNPGSPPRRQRLENRPGEGARNPPTALF